MATTGARSSASSAAMKRSPGPIFWSAGTQKPITSTSVRVARTTSLRRWPSSVRGRCRPGVSTRMSCASSRVMIPRTACRVVCGLALVITILAPTSALVSVDLPALGRPTKQAKPERKLTDPSSHGSISILDSFQIGTRVEDVPDTAARLVESGPRITWQRVAVLDAITPDEHLDVETVAGHLSDGVNQPVLTRAVENWRNVDADLGARVAKTLNK